MLGIITWIIGKNGDGQKSIERVSIDSISEQSRVEYLCSLFNNLSLDESTPTGECKAWLHIQDGADLFCASPIGEPISKDNNFAILPEKISFSQDKLILRKAYKEEENKEKKDDPILPILHISTLNLLEKEAPFKGIPRYVEIMDSSIWNLYFNIEDYYKGIDIRSWIIEKIANNTQKGIYNLSIAQEYADLNARLAKQSFISELMGHGRFVSPFVFHSERKMCQQLREEEQEVWLKKIQSHSWRILLVDDKWEKPLSLAKGGNSTINKKDIIEQALKSLKFNVVEEKTEGSKDKCIYLECAESTEKALAKMKDKKYDIILLDYLLDNEYGYRIFSQLKNEEEKKTEIYSGPLGRNFFMFISAFTTAVDERLHSEAIARSKDYWYIGEGACPTNTPEQFKLYLINLMWKRLDDSGINDLTASHIYNLLHKIFLPKEKCKDQTSVRKRANENYREILSLQYHYQRLLKDVEMADKIQDTKGSVLVTEFISWQTNLGGLLEHLVQLVHITAFGTVRQWPELWEEYIFCKAQFDDVFDEELNRLKIKEESTKQLDQFIKNCLGEEPTHEKTECTIELALKLKDELYHDIEQHILNLRAL
ncbi:MAG: response regulator [Paludibacteraceae bacterium]|nr:response regulator [Paludibacteraceae bacterium]